MSDEKNDIIDITADGSNIYAAVEPDRFSRLESIADVIGYLYKDKIIQVYWGETGGSTNYSDFEIPSNLYVEGKVLWGRGEVFALECEVHTAQKKFKTVMVFNAYNVYMITPLDGVDIMNCFKGRLKKLKSRGNI